MQQYLHTSSYTTCIHTDVDFIHYVTRHGCVITSYSYTHILPFTGPANDTKASHKTLHPKSKLQSVAGKINMFIYGIYDLSDEFCMIINASFKAAKAVQLQF